MNVAWTRVEIFKFPSRNVVIFKLYEEETLNYFDIYSMSLSSCGYPTFRRVLHLTFRHRASCILGQAFHYSPENAFYIFNSTNIFHYLIFA